MSGAVEAVGGVRRFRAYPEYRESGVEWLGDTPGHWEVRKATHLFEIGSGTTPKSEDQRFYGGDIPWITTSELRETVVSSTKKTVSAAALREYSSLKLHPIGSLAIAMYGATIGRLGILGVAATVNQACCVFTPNANMTTEFAFFAFQMARGYLISLGTGGGQPNLSQDLLRALRIPTPPLDEQRGIAEFLDRETGKIDALVAKKERLIELLQEKRTALITHAVTKGLDPTAPTKPSGIDWLGDIPAHWEVKKLWHLTPDDRQIMYGIVLPGPNFDGGVPIVKGGDVKPGRLALDRLNRTTREIEASYARSRLRGGDIVYAIRGSIGDAELVPGEVSGANLTQDAARISPAKGILGSWLLYAVKSDAIFRQLEVGALGATIRGINIRDLKRASVPVPPPREQQSIAMKLDERTRGINRLVEKVQDGLDVLREFRTALISAAVTGKIDVREEVA